MKKFFVFLFFVNLLFAGDRFEFVILKHKNFYKGHASSYRNFLEYLNDTTSIDPPLKVKEIEIGEEIFDYPFLYLGAKGSFPDFSRQSLELLSRHLNSGGFLLIDEIEEYRQGEFLNSVKEFCKKIFPELKLEKIPNDDVIFKSFYLKPKVSGRKLKSNFLYGINKDGRWVVVFSPNDLFGVWARDEEGKFLFECIPGGEPQRLEGIKLSVNLVMYSLTGTYKQDIIHRKFIEMKLETW